MALQRLELAVGRALRPVGARVRPLGVAQLLAPRAQPAAAARRHYTEPTPHTCMDGIEFNAPLDTVQVISEAVFTANHLTDTTTTTTI